jgi:hypothetical protein
MLGCNVSHYQILEKLGEGGMGVAHKAGQPLDRFVAIKVLPPDKLTDPERRRRFTQEAIIPTSSLRARATCSRMRSNRIRRLKSVRLSRPVIASAGRTINGSGLEPWCSPKVHNSAHRGYRDAGEGPDFAGRSPLAHVLEDGENRQSSVSSDSRRTAPSVECRADTERG